LSKPIWVVGGGDPAGQLQDASLLNEAIFQIASVVLAKGKPFLPRRVTNPPLRLVSIRQVGSGFAEVR
jgi:dihydrofolate reductase